RWQGGDDGDRMDQALVQHAEDEVDDEQRCEDEDRRALQRCSECLGVTLKAGLKRKWGVEIFFNLLDGADRIADRGARREIERDRYRRELALVIDYERRHLHHRIDQRG